jgi:hypothetical protein
VVAVEVEVREAEEDAVEVAPKRRATRRAEEDEARAIRKGAWPDQP